MLRQSISWAFERLNFRIGLSTGRMALSSIVGRCERGRRRRKSSAGLDPSCLGVVLNAARAKSSCEAGVVLRMCLTFLTAASERPFEAGFATEDIS